MKWRAFAPSYLEGDLMKRSLIALAAIAPSLFAQDAVNCNDLPSHSEFQAALSSVVTAAGNGGLAFQMWISAVNRDGVVCAVAFSGPNRGAQWPGSRVISAQKANTANAFSLPNFALSTANLYSAVQPGGSLYGLPHSNPVNPDVAYSGNPNNYGRHNDPMTGKRIGGVNVFGGGLALYTPTGELIGAIGVSGDTSCTDHIVAWKVRKALNLDNVPGGVGAGGSDNIVHDITTNASGHMVSAGGFGHPTCGAGAPATDIANNLPTSHPIGPRP